MCKISTESSLKGHYAKSEVPSVTIKFFLTNYPKSLDILLDTTFGRVNVAIKISGLKFWPKVTFSQGVRCLVTT